MPPPLGPSARWARWLVLGGLLATPVFAQEQGADGAERRAQSSPPPIHAHDHAPRPPDSGASLLEAIRGADGGWFQLPPPALGEQMSVHDPVRDRMIVHDASGVLWALEFAGEPRWSPLFALGEPPPMGPRRMAYDPARDRILVVVFGAQPSVWELALSPLPLWRRLQPGGTPPGFRVKSTLVLDPVGDQLILFGGVTGYVCGHVDCIQLLSTEAWALSLSDPPAWRKLAELGTLEDWVLARAEAMGVVDPVRRRLLVTGGYGHSGPWTPYDVSHRSDVWELGLGDAPSWRQLTVTGEPPVPGSGQASVLDAARGRLLVLVREAAGLAFRALSLDEVPRWGPLEVTTPQPAPRHQSSVVLDEARRRLVVYGGFPVQHEVLFLEAFDGAPRWTRWTPDASPASGVHREFPGLAYDPGTRRLLMYGGGYRQLNPTPDAWNDVRELRLDPLGSWQTVPTQGAGPTFGLLRPRVAFDSRRRRLLVAGGKGYATSGYYEHDRVWSLSLEGTPTWSEVASGGPGHRNGNTATYDPVRDRLLVIGGFDGERHRSDTWALWLEGSPRWELLLPDDAGPQQLSDHSAVYDPVRDRLLCYGGGPWSGLPKEGLWELPLSGEPRWNPLEPAGERPPRRSGHTAVLDAEGERMLVFSGDTGLGCPENVPYSTTCNDVWAFDLRGDRWHKLSPSGPLPSGRVYHAAAFDPVGNRLIAVGGSANGGAQGHTWILDLDPPGLELRVDVLPGSVRDPVSRRSMGVLPAAVFGTPDVPVSSIELSSVTLAGAGPAAHPHGGARERFRDVDGDGITDVVVHFDRSAMSLAPEDTLARLEGRLTNGIPVRGQAPVRLLPAVSASSQTMFESEPRPGEFALGLELESPGRGGLQVRLSLPGTASARLELFDLVGRRLSGREAGSLGAGVHRIRLARSGELPAGIYFVRVTDRERVLVRRAVVFP